MGEAGNQSVSVLLPDATVAIFGTDPDTLNAAAALQEDWRFARVNIQAYDAKEAGGIDTAIQVYAADASPDLVIVQEDEIDDGLTDKLGNLAQYCEENTAAIVVGPVNDVYLYRQLVEMGVSDYLVKPLQAEILSGVIAKTLIDRLGISESKLIAVTAAKGGVGVSSISQSLALGVSEILGKKTVLLDLSGGQSTVSVHFGYEPSSTLDEAVKAASSGDDQTLERLLFKPTDNLRILAGGSDRILDSKIQQEGLEALIDMLLAKYPNVVLDVSHARPSVARAIMTRANQVVVVSSPALASLRLSRTLIKEIKDQRGGEGENVDLLINLQELDKAHEISIQDIEEAIEIKVAGSIRFEKDIFLKAEAEGKTIIDDPQGKQLILERLLPVIAKSIDGVPQTADQEEGSTLLGGIMKKLKD
ncbi:MAG: AAA family ATPase [Pseudomonadota bacterium]